MAKISETEFARICAGLKGDRETIIRHNPVGSDKEILLWMLLGCLNSYLDLDDNEVPCFPGRPDERSYRDAIQYVIKGRAIAEFDPLPYIEELCKE